MADIFDDKNVNIKTWNEKYIKLDNINTQKKLEIFRIIKIKDNIVVFKSEDKKYISANKDSGEKMSLVDYIDNWTQFKLIKCDNGYNIYSLIREKYLKADDQGNIYADSKTADSYELFKINVTEKNDEHNNEHLNDKLELKMENFILKKLNEYLKSQIFNDNINQIKEELNSLRKDFNDLKEKSKNTNKDDNKFNSKNNIFWNLYKRGDIIPNNAIKAGWTKTDGDIYIGRCKNNSDETFIAKANTENGRFYNWWYNGKSQTYGEILIVDEKLNKKIDYENENYKKYGQIYVLRYHYVNKVITEVFSDKISCENAYNNLGNEWAKKIISKINDIFKVEKQYGTEKYLCQIPEHF